MTIVSQRACLLALMLLAASAARAVEISVDSLRLQWLDGFTASSGETPLQLTGPDGAMVLVSVFRIEKASAELSSERLETMVAFGERRLMEQAPAASTTPVPLAREALPDGSVLLSVGFETRDPFAADFLLKYLVVSLAGDRLGFVTIEGDGDVRFEKHVYRPLFESVRWLP